MTFNTTDFVGLTMLGFVVAAFILSRRNGLKIKAAGIVRKHIALESVPNDDEACAGANEARRRSEAHWQQDTEAKKHPLPHILKAKTNVAWDELPKQLMIIDGGKLRSMVSGGAPLFPDFKDGTIVNLVPHDELKRVLKEARLFRLGCLAGNPEPHSNN